MSAILLESLSSPTKTLTKQPASQSHIHIICNPHRLAAARNPILFAALITALAILVISCASLTARLVDTIPIPPAPVRTIEIENIVLAQAEHRRLGARAAGSVFRSASDKFLSRGRSVIIIHSLSISRARLA